MTSAATPPTTRSAERLAIAALTLAGLGISLNVQVLAALAPYLTDELQLEPGEFGEVISSGWLASAAGSLLLLPIVDRVGRRPPILWGVAVFALASLAHLFADGYASLVAARVAAGLSGGAAFTVASAAVADLVPYERRAAAMGMFGLGLFLAGPIGMPIAQWCAEAGMWGAIFALQAVIGAAAVVVLARTLPAGLGAGDLRFDWRVVRLPSVTPALLSIALYSGAFATTVQFLGLWLDATGLVPRDEQGLVWLGLGLFSALGAVGLTRLADRVGKRRFVLLTSAAVALGLGVLARAGSVATLVLIGVPVAMCVAARSGAMNALVSGLVAAERRGSVMALRAVVLNGGMALIVKAGGDLHESYGYGATLALAVTCIVASIALVLFAVREVGT